MTNEVRRGRNCVFSLQVHLVFVTKYRRPIFSKECLERIKEISHYICKNANSSVVEFNGEKDHVHLLIDYPPNVQISKLVNSIKGVTSRRLRQDLPEIAQHYYKNVLWSPSYFAGSVGGATLEQVKKYIEKQNTPA